MPQISFAHQASAEVGSLLIVPIVADKPGAGQDGCRSEINQKQH